MKCKSVTLISESEEMSSFADNYDPLTGEVRPATALSVSCFLRLVNSAFAGRVFRVRGEISSVNLYTRAVYFTIKDPSDQACLSCLIWRGRYDLLGLSLRQGLEIEVEGTAEVYPPTGRFSLKAENIAVCGEGELRARREKLKAKLAAEGFFDPERKRPLPSRPRKIGLITSRDSAALGDFVANLSRAGMHIAFVHSAVEGPSAVAELLRALSVLRRRKPDLLVVLRGGGSLESLQAFDSEVLVRALVDFPSPVLVGVGHERDETLASLAADRGVSTPTAAAEAINLSWEGARERVALAPLELLSGGERMFSAARARLAGVVGDLSLAWREAAAVIAEKIFARERDLADLFAREISLSRERISLFEQTAASFEKTLATRAKELQEAEKLLSAYDPLRPLRQGYALVSGKKGVVSSVREAQIGEKLSIRLKDGRMGVEVESKEIA